ncbi:MAG TPA: 50S ribosomal protein L24 [Fimbriimonas sp.]
MPTKAENKQKQHPVKLKVRRGDKVVIISGKDKGQIGFVFAVDPEKQKVIVLKENEEQEGQWLPLNAAVKHRKAKFQGERSARVKIPVPIHASNVMVIDPKTNEPTRLGRRKGENGKLERYGKKSGEVIPDQPMDWGKE